MRVFRIAVRDHHFGQRESVEDRPGFVLVLVEVRDVVEHNAFTVVEAHVHREVLPLNDAACDFEADALGLCNVNGFEVGTVAALFLDRLDRVVVGRSLADRSSDLGHVNVDDFSLVRVVDGAEIQRIRVLRVVWVRAVVHQCLLQSDAGPKSLIVPNGPGVAVDLVHFLGGDTDQATLLDNLGVFAHDLLHGVEVFHGDQRLHSRRLRPADDLALREVDMTVEHLAVGGDDHDVGDAARSRGALWILQPFQHFILGRLQQRHGVVI